MYISFLNQTFKPDFLSFDNYQYYIKHKNEISIIKFPHNVHIISEMNFNKFPQIKAVHQDQSKQLPSKLIEKKVVLSIQASDSYYYSRKFKSNNFTDRRGTLSNGQFGRSSCAFFFSTLSGIIQRKKKKTKRRYTVTV